MIADVTRAFSVSPFPLFSGNGESKLGENGNGMRMQKEGANAAK